MEISKGKWIVRYYSDGEVAVGVRLQSGFNAVCHIVSRKEEKQHNALFIAEAYDVANETGLMPRELLEQRDDLLVSCKWLLKAYKGMLSASGVKYKKGQIPGITQAEQAISNTKKGT